MKFVRAPLVLTVLVAGVFAGCLEAADTVKLDATGMTNENDQAVVKCEIGGGKKLQAENWLMELKIGDTVIDVTKCMLGQGNLGKSGSVKVLMMNLAAGTYKVKIKVKLNDGTFVTDERDVKFEKILGDPVPGLPPPQ